MLGSDWSKTQWHYAGAAEILANLYTHMQGELNWHKKINHLTAKVSVTKHY